MLPMSVSLARQIFSRDNTFRSLRRKRLQKVRARTRRSSGNWTILLIFIVLFGSGCATPVGVTRLDEQAAHRELNANVLSTGKPSAYSTQILERTALSERFKTDPEPVLAELNSGLGKTDERDRLFALSELSFAHAEASQNQSYYLASAAYAYAFLFPANPADAPGAYDPRLRLAVDLYNRGIALGLATKDGKEVDLSERQLEFALRIAQFGGQPGRIQLRRKSSDEIRIARGSEGARASQHISQSWYRRCALGTSRTVAE